MAKFIIELEDEAVNGLYKAKGFATICCPVSVLMRSSMNTVCMWRMMNERKRTNRD